MEDRVLYKSNWEIFKFDDGVFAKKVRRLFARASELLVLADHYMRRGDLMEVARKRLHAESLIREGEQYAYDASAFPENLLLNEGITEALNLIGGIAATAFDNTNANLGVGDSNAAEAATQTGLQASTNKLYKGMEAGFPSVSGQTESWKSSFGSSEANWAWEEFTVASGNSDAATNLNRKISSQGTKTSGQTWTLQLDITLS